MAWLSFDHERLLISYVRMFSLCRIQYSLFVFFVNTFCIRAHESFSEPSTHQHVTGRFISYMALTAKLPSAAAEATASVADVLPYTVSCQICAFEHDDGDVVFVEQGQNVRQFMVQPHVAGRVAEVILVEYLEDVRGHMLPKSGGGEAVIEQRRDAVALGQAQEVGPGDGGHVDVFRGTFGAQDVAEPVDGNGWRLHVKNRMNSRGRCGVLWHILQHRDC